MRPITDCCQLDEVSVNYSMIFLVQSFKYKSVDCVTEMLNSNDFMVVVDTKCAYRLVPIDSDHSRYQGFCWDLDGVEKFYVDHRLCFGLRCGPYYFNL